VTTDRPIFAGFVSPQPRAGEITPLDSEVVELALLLPRWQADALEDAAAERGLTTGQMLRKVIGATIKGTQAARV
jgi:hypothetical protein